MVWCAPLPCPYSDQQAAEFVAAGVYNKRRHLLGPATGKQGAVGHERRHRLFAYAWCLYARDRSTDTCPLSSSCHVCSLSRLVEGDMQHTLTAIHALDTRVVRARACHTNTNLDSARPSRVVVASCTLHFAWPQRDPCARAHAAPSRIGLVHGSQEFGQSLLRCLPPDPVARGCWA